MAAEKLYTPQLLSLTVELANWPAIETLALHGEARSATCGSTLMVDLATDDHGLITSLGLRVRACAIGQAAATIFARHARGVNYSQISAVHDRLEGWLDGEAPIANWPDLEMLEHARSYPARHGAIMLPWKAAITALSSAPAAS